MGFERGEGGNYEEGRIGVRRGEGEERGVEWSWRGRREREGWSGVRKGRGKMAGMVGGREGRARR